MHQAKGVLAVFELSAIGGRGGTAAASAVLAPAHDGGDFDSLLGAFEAALPIVLVVVDRGRRLWCHRSHVTRILCRRVWHTSCTSPIMSSHDIKTALATLKKKTSKKDAFKPVLQSLTTSLTQLAKQVCLAETPTCKQTTDACRYIETSSDDHTIRSETHYCLRL